MPPPNKPELDEFGFAYAHEPVIVLLVILILLPDIKIGSAPMSALPRVSVNHPVDLKLLNVLLLTSNPLTKPTIP